VLRSHVLSGGMAMRRREFIAALSLKTLNIWAFSAINPRY
jgi:hypothetical protein